MLNLKRLIITFSIPLFSISNAVSAENVQDCGIDYHADRAAPTVLFVKGILNDAGQVLASSDALRCSLKDSGLLPKQVE